MGNCQSVVAAVAGQRHLKYIATVGVPTFRYGNNLSAAYWRDAVTRSPMTFENAST